MVVDIGRFLSLETFTAEVRALIAHIKSGPLAPGVAEVVYPGEQAARLRSYRRRHGLVIDPETWQTLGTLAQERGIRVPDSV
jgi:LDH2 family malate/lactate/ureidoglycolate dehydrogenase